MKILSVLPLAVVAALAFACGSDGETTPSPTATSSPPLPAATVAAANVSSPEAAPVLPVTVRDKDGNEVTITDISRIVPLNGEVTEVIYALGLGDNIVGVDTSATYPPEAASRPSIGYQRALSAEGIISLDPSLIIGTEAAGPPEVLEQLRQIGVPVLIMHDPVALDDAAKKIRAVGEALGVPNRGDELARQTEADIAEAKALAARATSQPRVMFLYLRGAAVQVIMGEGAGGDIMIETAGGIDVGVESGIQGNKPITPEAVVAAQPDFILVLTAGLQSVGGIDGLLQIPGIAETPAGENRAVIDMADQYLLGHGPRIGQALKELTLAIHPELSQ